MKPIVGDSCPVGFDVVKSSQRGQRPHHRQQDQPADRHDVICGSQIHCWASSDLDHAHDMLSQLLREAEVLFWSVWAFIAEQQQ